MNFYNISIMAKIVILCLLILLSSCGLVCDVCYYPVKTVRQITKFIIPKTAAIQALELLCMRKYSSKLLCKKVGQQLAPIGIQNFLDAYINPNKICSSLCGNLYIPYSSQKQSERILNEEREGQQKVITQNLEKYIAREQYQIKKSSETLKVLHLTDIHLDLHYKQKSSVYCDYPICCHEEQGFPQNPDAQARPFGSIKCDTPEKLFYSTLDYIKGLQTDIDLIVATGDFSAHDEWQKTEETIQMNEKFIADAISQKLGPQTYILSSTGNNDYTPDHQTSLQEMSYIIKVTNIKTDSQILTFISLNNILCDNMNLYLFGDQTYAIYQLKLLEQQIIKNDNIYLFGHIPPIHEQCAEDYRRVYRSLVTKYSHKIKGQFYGHTHADQLFINTSPLDNTTVGFGFVSASISPYFVGQSRFRVYDLQRDGVINYQQHHFTNLNSSEADWKFEYDFRKKYHLPSSQNPITIEEMDNIVHKIFTDKETQKGYLNNTKTDVQTYNNKHCLILDDSEKQRKCRGDINLGISDKLFDLIEKFRGKWSYQKNITL